MNLQFNYDTNQSPPQPTVKVVVASSQSGRATRSLVAIVDTGADATLIPLKELKSLAALVGDSRWIRNLWGERQACKTFIVEVQIEELVLPGIEVLGYPGDEVILGRDWRQQVTAGLMARSNNWKSPKRIPGANAAHWPRNQRYNMPIPTNEPDAHSLLFSRDNSRSHGGNSMPNRDLLQRLTDDDVKFISLQFTDLLGTVKSVDIPAHRANNALEHGVWFDGSSVEGFARIQESDMLLRLDPDTYRALPWSSPERRRARVLCDIYNTDGTPFEGDPRYILKRQLARAKALGYQFNVGPELEFFLLRNNNGDRVQAVPHDVGSYFDFSARDEYVARAQRHRTGAGSDGPRSRNESSRSGAGPARDRLQIRRRAGDSR